MFSIIIPTCNRNDFLRKCLDCLDPKVQTISSIDYEVIVTDDSNDNIAKNLTQEFYPWVKWVEGPKHGPAANRNNGAKHAITEWLVFIDDDCLPDNHLINQYFDALKSNPQIDVFEGCIKADRDCRSFNEESPINETGGYLWSCNFMIKKGLFDEIHGFDEGFPSAAVEDVELAYRIQKTCKKIEFVKNAFVVHPWRTQKNIYDVTMQRFKSVLYFLSKHPEQLQKINAKYYLHMVWSETGFLFTRSFKYKFRGFFGKVIYIILHFYFALYFTFNRNKVNNI